MMRHRVGRWITPALFVVTLIATIPSLAEPVDGKKPLNPENIPMRAPEIGWRQAPNRIRVVDYLPDGKQLLVIRDTTVELRDSSRLSTIHAWPRPMDMPDFPARRSMIPSPIPSTRRFTPHASSILYLTRSGRLSEFNLSTGKSSAIAGYPTQLRVRRNKTIRPPPDPRSRSSNGNGCRETPASDCAPTPHELRPRRRACTATHVDYRQQSN